MKAPSAPIKILCCIVLLFAACQSDTPDAPPVWIEHSGQITVDTSSRLAQSIPANHSQGRELSFSTDSAWTSSVSFTSTKDHTTWLRLSPDHGDAAGKHTVRLLLDHNDTHDDRTATIELRCGMSSIHATITQSSRPDFFTYGMTEMVHFTSDSVASGRRIKFQYNLNDDYITAVRVYELPQTKTLRFSLDFFEDIMHYTKFLSAEPSLKLSMSGVFSKRFNRIDQVSGNPPDNYLYSYSYENDRIVEKTETQLDQATITHTDSYIRDDNGNCIQHIHQCMVPDCNQESFSFELGDVVSELYQQIVGDYPIQLPLLLIDQPDYLHALGFYGQQDTHYITKITPDDPKSEIMPLEFEYEFTATAKELDQLEVGETCDAMTITVKQGNNASPDSEQKWHVFVTHFF